MNDSLSVIDKNGAHGVIDATAPPPFDGNGEQVIVRFDTGGRIVVPTAALVPRKEQGFFLPHAFGDFEVYNVNRHVNRFQADNQIREAASLAASQVTDEAANVTTHQAIETEARQADGDDGGDGETLVIPVIAEALEIERRRIETARVRITKRINEREQIVSEPAMQETINVERVSLNHYIDAPPPIRYEGDTMIVPLVEEVVVTEKRLMLKEELHITRRREVVPSEPQRIVLRSEEAIVERVEPRTPPSSLNDEATQS